MKKVFTAILLLVILSNYFYAQKSSTTSPSTADESVSLKQGELLKWESLPNAKKYQVAIQKLDDSGNWVKYKTVNTKKTYHDTALPPGEYRVSITAINALGKKGKASDWVEFIVLSEEKPFLYDNYLPQVSKWKSPVLFINRNDTNLAYVTESSRFIKSPAGFPENTLALKGRNIFYSDTKFYLNPVESSKNGGLPYEFYSRNRERVELKLLERNSKNYMVYLAYDPASLKSGYYDIEAVNPDGSKDSLSILVRSDENLSIEPYDFEIDQRYKVVQLEVDENNPTTEFTVVAKGMNGEIKFLLKSETENSSYPFDYKLPAPAVECTIVNREFLQDDSQRIRFSVRSSDLKTGMYSFMARNSEGKDESFKIHVLCPLKQLSNQNIEIKKIKTKYKKSTKKLNLEIRGTNLSSIKKLTYVSQYKEMIDSNTIVDFSTKVTKNGTVLTSVIDSSLFELGDCALQIDTEDDSFIYTFNLNNRFKSKATKLSDEKIKDIFLKPLPKVFVEDFSQLNEPVIKYMPMERRTLVKVPAFMPYQRVYAGIIPMLENSGIAPLNLRAELDLFNVGWFSINPGVIYYPQLFNLDAILGIKFMAPGKYLSPYFGISAGYRLMDWGTALKDSFKVDNFSKDKLFIHTSVGVVLFSFLDFTYDLDLYGLTDKENRYFIDSLSIGARIPIKPVYYETVTVSQRMRISDATYINGSDVKLDENKVKAINFVVDEIAGFNNQKNLKSITFNGGTRIIGENAFADCPNLEDINISIYANLSEIRDGAFKNDKGVSTIIIPYSVVYIGKDAFAGWTEEQTIRLEWNSTDAADRNLEGLKNTKAKIIYRDGVEYEK